MSVQLLYKEFLLGQLDKKSNVYIYSSNINGESEAMKTFFVLEHYPLLNSKHIMSDTIFSFFKNHINNIRAREDIIKEAKILLTDDDYTVLKKFSKLNQDPDGFWFKTI